MRVGVTRETAAGERRVALVPDSVGRLAQTGIGVVVEPGAGVEASYPDEEYREAGAELGRPGTPTPSPRSRHRRPTRSSGCARVRC